MGEGFQGFLSLGGKRNSSFCVCFGEKAMDQELEIKPTHGVTGDLGRPACDVGRQEGGLTDPCGLLVTS